MGLLCGKENTCQLFEKEGNIEYNMEEIKNKLIGNKEIIKEISELDYIKEITNEIMPNDIPFEILPHIIEQKKNNVCKIIREDGLIGTGFLCKIPYPDSFKLLPVLITCYHVLGINEIQIGGKIELKFNDGKMAKNILINESRKIYISDENEYDTTIIEIEPNDGFKNSNFLEVDNLIYDEENIDNIEMNEVNKTVYLIHYPKGLNSKLSFGTIKKIENCLIKHMSKTYKGSSGAPIFNLSTQKVIGIHKGDHKKFKYQVGTLLKYPINNFNLYNQNKIVITLEVKKEDINKKVYFLDNTDYINKETNIKNYHNNLKELNEANTALYINNNRYKFEKYFLPNEEGIYIIELLLFFPIKDCSFMFTNCKNITNIDFSKFITKYAINMEYMFSGCTNLKNLNLTNFNTENVINMRGMFGECSKILNYDYLKGDFFSPEGAEDVIYYEGCSNLNDLNLSSFDTKNVNDMSYMFCGCKNLNKIKMSYTFITKKVVNFYGMFGECENIEYLDLSSFDTENANIMTGMFCRCYNLKIINFSSSFNTKNVINMSGMFSQCESLETLDLSSFDTKKVVIMSGMFLECYHLKDLDLSSFITKNVINMENMFYGSYNLQNLNLSSFDTRKVEKMEYIFDYCSKLNLSASSLNNNNINNLLEEYNNRTFGNLYFCPLAGCNRRHHAKWYKPY